MKEKLVRKKGQPSCNHCHELHRKCGGKKRKEYLSLYLRHLSDNLLIMSFQNAKKKDERPCAECKKLGKECVSRERKKRNKCEESRRVQETESQELVRLRQENEMLKMRLIQQEQRMKIPLLTFGSKNMKKKTFFHSNFPTFVNRFGLVLGYPQVPANRYNQLWENKGST